MINSSYRVKKYQIILKIVAVRTLLLLGILTLFLVLDCNIENEIFKGDIDNRKVLERFSLK